MTTTPLIIIGTKAVGSVRSVRVAALLLEEAGPRWVGAGIGDQVITQAAVFIGWNIEVKPTNSLIAYPQPDPTVAKPSRLQIWIVLLAHVQRVWRRLSTPWRLKLDGREHLRPRDREVGDQGLQFESRQRPIDGHDG